MGFPRKMSLHSSAVIGRVIRQGRSYAQDPLKIHLLPAGKQGDAKLAFAVPKYGHSIVERKPAQKAIAGYCTLIGGKADRLAGSGSLQSPCIRARVQRS